MTTRGKAAASGGAGAATVVLVDDAAIGLVARIGGEGNWGELLGLLQDDLVANQNVLGLAVAGAAIAIGRAGWRRLRPLIDLDRSGISDLDEIDWPIDGESLTRGQARKLRR